MCFTTKISPKKCNNIYYLLYQLHNSNSLWIIKITDDYNILENNIKNVSIKEKTIGKYYIIQRYENPDILYKKFKQFQLYYPKLYDCVVFESQ